MSIETCLHESTFTVLYCVKRYLKTYFNYNTFYRFHEAFQNICWLKLLHCSERRNLDPQSYQPSRQRIITIHPFIDSCLIQRHSSRFHSKRITQYGDSSYFMIPDCLPCILSNGRTSCLSSIFLRIGSTSSLFLILELHIRSGCNTPSIFQNSHLHCCYF